MSNISFTCFLLSLIGCISAQFVQQTQWELARKSRSKRISCTVDGSISLSSTAIHWYRQKPGEALQRILHFAAGASTATLETEFSHRFSGGKKDKTLSLTITGVNEEDAANYYCALYRGDTVTHYAFQLCKNPALPSHTDKPQKQPHWGNHDHFIPMQYNTFE